VKKRKLEHVGLNYDFEAVAYVSSFWWRLFPLELGLTATPQKKVKVVKA
jgi:hypothetical protein